MKSKALLLTLLFALTPWRALATEDTPRPAFFTSIYNNSLSLSNPGILYIPTQTPLGNQACAFDNSSTITSSVTTATELSYVHGATSNLQAQINAISGGSGGPRFTNTVSTGYSIPTLTVDNIINVNTNVGVIPIVLPNATASNGWCVDVKNIGLNSVAVSTTSMQTIDGQSSDIIADQFDSKHYCAVGGNWFNY